MAVFRVPPKCPHCGADYDAIHNQYTANFVGDTFVMWDIQNHKCKSTTDVLSAYEERLERIVDEIKRLPTLEAIGVLRKYVPPVKSEL